MSKRIVLHVGFDKVGSSSLQKYLFNNKSISSEGNYKYLAINKSGNLDTFEKINTVSRSNFSGYVSSFPKIGNVYDPRLIKKQLNICFMNSSLKRGETPILSCEG